jgi:hypothetical protein
MRNAGGRCRKAIALTLQWSATRVEIEGGFGRIEPPIAKSRA